MRNRPPHAPRAFYHVTMRGNARQAIFRDEEDRDALEKCLTDALDYYCAEIHAYCWMANHLHLLLRVSLAYCDAKWRTVLNTGSSVQVNYVSRKQVIYVQETLAITSTRLTHITGAVRFRELPVPICTTVVSLLVHTPTQHPRQNSW